MEKINPGVHKYREYGIYLYENDGQKHARIFFSGESIKTHFIANDFREAYNMATNEIDAYLGGEREER